MPGSCGPERRLRQGRRAVGRRRHAQQRHLSVDASLRAHLDSYAKRGRTPQTSRSMVTMWSLEFANHKQSLVLSSGGGGNRTAGCSPGSDDSRTVSRTGIEENTSKEHEENALPDILVTMSQIPDVNRELAETRSMHALFAAVKREIESS
jgi:hypothetical protein